MNTDAVNLYGWLNDERNHTLTGGALGYLDGQGVKVIARLAKVNCILVEYKYSWWTLADNGGEINVEQVNYPDGMRSVPYMSDNIPLDAETMCYRILCAITGKPIDYEWRGEVSKQPQDGIITRDR